MAGHDRPIRILDVVARDGRLHLRRWELHVDLVLPDANNRGSGPDGASRPVPAPDAVAEVIAGLDVLGLDDTALDAAVDAAAADGIDVTAPPRHERVALRASADGWWHVTVGEPNPEDPAPVTTTTVDDPAEVPDRVLWAFTRRHLHRHAPARLHAGAVADAAGGVAVVLGPSGTGKSTITSHLVAGGCDLVNDEQVTIEPTAGVLTGFTRPVACKPGGAAHLPGGLADRFAQRPGTILVTAVDLGGRHRLAGRPRLVVLAERNPDAEPEVEVLDALDAAHVLMDNNLDLVARPADALDAFGWLVATAPVVRVRYRDSAEGASTVAGLLADPPEARGGPWWVWPDTAVDGAVDAAGGSGRAVLRAAPDAWGLGFEQGALLLNAATNTVLRTNATGAGLWASLPADAWPQHPDVETFIAQLSAQGLLLRDT